MAPMTGGTELHVTARLEVGPDAHLVEDLVYDFGCEHEWEINTAHVEEDGDFVVVTIETRKMRVQNNAPFLAEFERQFREYVPYDIVEYNAKAVPTQATGIASGVIGHFGRRYV